MTNPTEKPACADVNETERKQTNKLTRNQLFKTKQDSVLDPECLTHKGIFRHRFIQQSRNKAVSIMCKSL